MTPVTSRLDPARDADIRRRHRAGLLLANVPETICALAMIAITIALFAGVVWRYVFVDPLTWTDEISRALFVWLSFIGAAVGVKRGIHSAVIIFEARMSPHWQRVAALFAIAITALMAGVLVYTGALETVINAKQVLPVTSVSRAWQFVAVPVSGVLMLIYLVPITRQALRGQIRAATNVADGE